MGGAQIPRPRALVPRAPPDVESDSEEEEWDPWRRSEFDLGGGQSWVYGLWVLDASVPSTASHSMQTEAQAFGHANAHSQMVNKVLQDAFEDKRYDSLWLAEGLEYDSIDINCDDAPGLHRRQLRCTQVDADWTSPWAGKGIDDVIGFVRNVPSPKALNKLYFVVLDKAEYDTFGRLSVFKTVDGDAESLPCRASAISIFLDGHDRDAWPDMQDDWLDRGVVAMQ